jgi:quercetin dioxygenase-like cupin family protein
MTQQPFEHVSFDKPDEVRQGENWRLDIVKLASGAQVGRLTIQPGFRWTEHVKPVAGTELCMAPHQQYHLRGRIHVLMADGSEAEAGPGEILSLPPGHDAWVVGDEPAVTIDWQGASVWGRPL